MTETYLLSIPNRERMPRIIAAMDRKIHKEVLTILFHAHKPVGGAALAEMIGYTRDSLPTLISNLRAELQEYNLYIKALRGKGYALTDKENYKPQTYAEKKLEAADMRDWKPSHIGHDPKKMTDLLLDGLRKHHYHGHGCYPGYRSPEDPR